MAWTIADETAADPASAHGAPRRILIAMHGSEAEGWAREVVRATPRSGVLRLLLVDGGAAPAFTSLLPAARRRLAAAVAAWRRDVEERRRAVLEMLLPVLPAPAEIVRVWAGDPGRAIAIDANEWPADLVPVGHDGCRRVERALIGTVHERVVRLARCPVLVIAADPLSRIGRSPLRAGAAAREGA